jgi:hypothetical protein
MISLESARQHALSARFPQLLNECRRLVAGTDTSLTTLLDVGVLLLGYGFVTLAQECFARARALASNDLPPVIGLANAAHDAGNHGDSRDLYAALLQRAPEHLIVRRNALLGLEYDPEVSDVARLTQARDWGEWATIRGGGPHRRPILRPLADRALRIGYVSADFCQHTVGLLVKDVIAAHDPQSTIVITYSAGRVDDWVTKEIRGCSHFRDIAALDDVALAKQIRADGIDVLVDLSGHTAGSRLTMFAQRPAPVQVSWLGYFSTTGLSSIDAVLLDEWHAPAEMATQFVEQIVRLPGGRLCYRPVPWAPTEVGPPPSFANAYVTFGCFNNTSKLNDSVFDVWAAILSSVPGSRLVLKWRTFNDEGVCEHVREAFVRRGINPQRLELRGPSFHVDVLREYADIDIALDPFPFTGGLTSCEALWMGVPVVTWPQSRVVSRQTFALLSVVGLPELVAWNAAEYVRIVVELATDLNRLSSLRNGLRSKMLVSALMDHPSFAKRLEHCLVELYREIEAREKEQALTHRTVLHVGAGHRTSGARLPAALQAPGWREIRFDIDPTTEPDIIGSVTDMSGVSTGSIDALYSAHNIEHVFAFEVPAVFKEFLRILKPNGFVVLTCPDLQAVCALVADDKLTDTAYMSPAGPITPHDILYGHGAALAAGHHYMAHKGGFTLKSLTAELQSAGFHTIAGLRRAKGLDLWVLATKAQMNEADIRKLAGTVLPN